MKNSDSFIYKYVISEQLFCYNNFISYFFPFYIIFIISLKISLLVYIHDAEYFQIWKVIEEDDESNIKYSFYSKLLL